MPEGTFSPSAVPSQAQEVASSRNVVPELVTRSGITVSVRQIVTLGRRPEAWKLTVAGSPSLRGSSSAVGAELGPTLVTRGRGGVVSLRKLLGTVIARPSSRSVIRAR